MRIEKGREILERETETEAESIARRSWIIYS